MRLPSVSLSLLATFLIIVASGNELIAKEESSTKLVVLAAAGWHSASESEEEPFLEFEFVVGDVRSAAGIGREGIIFTPFSYDYPDESYSPCSTERSIHESALSLDHQIRDLMNAHPNAGLVLVGHSLGGVIHTYWASEIAEERLLERVQGLITLNSPVSGLEIAGLPFAGFLANASAVFHCWSPSSNAFVEELRTDSDLVKVLAGAKDKLAVGELFHWGSCLDIFVPCQGVTSPGSLGPCDEVAGVSSLFRCKVAEGPGR